MSLKSFGIYAFQFFLLAGVIESPLFAAEGDPTLKISLETSGMDGKVNTVVLRQWAPAELSALKSATTRERDPSGGETVSWSGTPLLAVIDESMRGLKPEERAHIDLAAIRNATGERALIPRSFLIKFSLLLARARAGKPLEPSRGPWLTVPTWTSRAPKILDEKLPIESFFVPGVTEVVLTSYQLRHGRHALAQKTDPSAVRGEKLFVQSCLGCHGVTGSHGGTPPDQLRSAAALKHRPVPGLPQYMERDQKALRSYFEAWSPR